MGENVQMNTKLKSDLFNKNVIFTQENSNFTFT